MLSYFDRMGSFLVVQNMRCDLPKFTKFVFMCKIMKIYFKNWQECTRLIAKNMRKYLMVC